MSGKKIRDNPSFVKMDKMISDVKKYDESLYKDQNFFKPFKNIEEVELFQDVPDKFNDYFSDLGWIAYDHMSVLDMKEAVDLVEMGNLEAAENLLINYTDRILELFIARLEFQDVFKKRYFFIWNAKIDYLKGRYYACIPIILMVIDGVVSDIGEKGFFADGVDLEAWDSMAGHSTGLMKLKEIFYKKRKKTRTETITIPFRNGILHGRDLGYANKTVAAKSWAALFAVGEFIRSKQTEYKSKGDNQAKTMDEDEFYRIMNLVNKWEPRNLIVNEDFKEFGTPDDYVNGTPERVMVEFLHFWIEGHNLEMSNRGSYFPSKGKTRREKIEDLRLYLDYKKLDHFRLLIIKDTSPSATDIDVQLEFGDANSNITKFTLLFEDDNGRGLVRGEKGGSWKVAIN
jgi:hypothetical protein